MSFFSKWKPLYLKYKLEVLQIFQVKLFFQMFKKILWNLYSILNSNMIEFDQKKGEFHSVCIEVTFRRFSSRTHTLKPDKRVSNWYWKRSKKIFARNFFFLRKVGASQFWRSLGNYILLNGST